MPSFPDNHHALRPGSEAFCTHNHCYRIERVLGQGGFGITYLATCLKDFTPAYRSDEVIRVGSKLAIKECFPKEYACREGECVRPRPDVQDSEWHLEDKSEMFLCEARMLSFISARYRGENLVPIYHCGRLRSKNITFFVMPYLEGGGLGCQAGKLTPYQIADILYQLLQALGVCHNQQEPMLHLDIKPDNIMLKDGGCRRWSFFSLFSRQSQQRWVPVLIDFGLARQSDGNGIDVRGLSRRYAPWEQASNNNGERVGTWTDVYALGATMYYTITGKNPPAFENRPPRADGPDPYIPLLQMPHLVESFRRANPTEGDRLLWSIDVALQTQFSASPSHLQGSHSRWLNANEWMHAAFPYGPWETPRY